MSENNENVEKIEVEIKDSDTEELKKIKAELKAEQEKSEDYREKLDLIGQIDFEKKRKELNCEDPEINSPEKLLAWEKGQKSKTKNEQPSGAPLSQGQYTGGIDPFLKQEFENPRAMVAEIKARMKSSDPETAAQARTIYDYLLKKAIAQGGTGKTEGIGLKELTRKPKKESD